MKKAKDAFDGWEKANNELKDAGNDTGSMDTDVKLYRDFFYSSNGNGKADFEELDSLISDTKQNQEYFHKLKSVLEGEKFWDQSIAIEPAFNQYEKYKREADSCISGKKVEFVNDINRIRESIFPTITNIRIYPKRELQSQSAVIRSIKGFRSIVKNRIKRILKRNRMRRTADWKKVKMPEKKQKRLMIILRSNGLL